MRSESTQAVRPDHDRTTWRNESFPKAPRPWLLAALALACIALVIVASLGPWLYIERGPARALEISRVSGVATDGVFSLFFAMIAGVAALIALFRPSLWILAWVAFAAMLLCTLVGLFDWVFFDPMDLAPGQRAELIRVEWGLKLLTITSPIGAVCTLLFARHLMHGDY